LIGYPWHILSAGSVLYLLSLPMGWKSYRDHERAAAVPATVPAEAAVPSNPPATFPPAVKETDQDNRPSRLN
jgi:CDP-diacylglycerol--serine O-phosphatidyltransferase